MPNRLAGETSPYLLQHAHNPVDWYPWGDEALSDARTSDKPILLSVGYAACHWCHVMERESFEDPEVAALMNERFVCVKVDREERPDIDAIYMNAVQAMTGHGGWPMTVFLTPEGEPFYGGTYYPPEDRYGMPSFRKVLLAVADAWATKRADIEAQGRALVSHLDPLQGLEASNDPLTDDVVESAISGISRSFDAEWGGFGGAPKFPQAMVLDLLLRRGSRGDEASARMVKRSLDAMAAGGMFDQLGGGFARYSVDRYWLVPHFEKMLYDNALLLRTYARSAASTGNQRHHTVAEMTAAWMLREMRDPRGGFYSSLDADSEGEEGKYYVWSLDEVRAAVGPDADLAQRLYGFTDQGNFEGRNIPVYASEPDDVAAAERVRAALFAVREERVRPGIDDKVLTAWNGMAAAALAEAGALLRQPAWVEAAAEAMRFVLDTMRIDGRLMRAYRTGTVKHLAFAEDYAGVVEAALALYEATFDVTWLEQARWAADEAQRLFGDPSGDGFLTTGSDAPQLVARVKELTDNAVPSATSTLALELQRLALLTGDAAYEKAAVDCMRLVRDIASRSPLGFGRMLEAIHFHVSDAVEIVIVGPDDDARGALLDVVHERWVPDKVVVVAADDSPAIPLLEGRAPETGAQAFVCHRGACDLPVSEPHELRAQLVR